MGAPPCKHLTSLRAWWLEDKPPPRLDEPIGEAIWSQVMQYYCCTFCSEVGSLSGACNCLGTLAYPPSQGSREVKCHPMTQPFEARTCFLARMCDPGAVAASDSWTLHPPPLPCSGQQPLMAPTEEPVKTPSLSRALAPSPAYHLPRYHHRHRHRHNQLLWEAAGCRRPAAP